MLMRLSSNGRLVIPKTIRENLQLQNNNLLRIQVKENKIILEPLPKDMVRHLYGKYAGQNFINELEAEHRQEIAKAQV